jgi:hypothetical protein
MARLFKLKLFLQVDYFLSPKMKDDVVGLLTDSTTELIMLLSRGPPINMIISLFLLAVVEREIIISFFRDTLSSLVV